MQITRRDALMGAGAAALVAGVPGAVRADKLPLDDAEIRALAMFRQLNPVRREILLNMTRMALKAQRHNENQGFTAADDARSIADVERQFGEVRS